MSYITTYVISFKSGSKTTWVKRYKNEKRRKGNYSLIFTHVTINNIFDCNLAELIGLLLVAHNFVKKNRLARGSMISHIWMVYIDFTSCENGYISFIPGRIFMTFKRRSHSWYGFVKATIGRWLFNWLVAWEILQDFYCLLF